MDEISFTQPLSTQQYEPTVEPAENYAAPIPAEYKTPIYVFVTESVVVNQLDDDQYVYIDVGLNVSNGSSNDHIVKRLKFNKETLAQEAKECSQYKSDHAVVVENEINPYDLKKIATQRMMELAGIPSSRNFV